MNAVIVGASGYAGQELVKLIDRHRHINLAGAVSNSYTGKRISELIGKHRGSTDLRFINMETFLERYSDFDIIFLALPHGECMKIYDKIKTFQGIIIDLSADFRLDNESEYNMWRTQPHSIPEELENFVYGLADIDKDQITSFNRVANPGCYPTSILLGVVPTLRSLGKYVKSINIFSMSGVSGAGVKPTSKNAYCEINENAYAYGLKNHNHVAEITTYIRKELKSNMCVQFTPHLVPLNRGILSTIYISIDDEARVNKDMITKIYNEFYINAIFVEVLDTLPSIGNVAFTNYCDIYVDYDENTNNIIISSAIDNLLKGAAGQALQNANIILGYDENEGLI